MDPVDAGAPVQRTVASTNDVAAIRRSARSLAGDVGFDLHDSERIAIATTEVATNLVRHAGGGHIAISPIMGACGAGIQIMSTDHGPGIRDVEQALRDGFSTAGGLGSGLPAVHRLMDELAIETGDRGTTIVARKWLKDQ
jgi:serine/threonine-protein kinase RsbT